MRVLFVVLAVVVGGCSKAGPTLTGGKPVDYWIGALNELDPKLRKTAAFKLGNVGSANPAAFPALLGAIKDSDPGVRCEVILALLKCGSQAKEAVPALDDVWRHDPDPKVRDYAARALEKIEGESAAAPR